MSADPRTSPTSSEALRPTAPRPRVAMVALALGAALVLGSMNGAAASAGSASQQLGQVYADALSLAVARGLVDPGLAERALALASSSADLAPGEKRDLLAELEAALTSAPAPDATDQATLDVTTLRFTSLLLPASVDRVSEGVTEASDPCEDDCSREYWRCALQCIAEWALCAAEAWGWAIVWCYAVYLACLGGCAKVLKGCLEQCRRAAPVAVDPFRIGLPPITVAIAELDDPTSGIRLLGGPQTLAGAAG